MLIRNGKQVDFLPQAEIEAWIKSKRVIGFDLDGTLLPFNGHLLFPQVREWFSTTYDGQSMFLATNQGGVPCHEAGWGDQFPSMDQVNERVYSVLSQLKGLTDMSISVYICYVYITSAGKIMVPRGIEPSPEYVAWRKPSGGMLKAYMREHTVAPEQIVFIGDRDDPDGKNEDIGAAQVAGVDFIDVWSWLGVPRDSLEETSQVSKAAAKADVQAIPGHPDGPGDS